MMSPLTMPSTAPDGHDMGMGSRRDSGASGSATDADETVLMLAKRIQVRFPCFSIQVRYHQALHLSLLQALLSENEAVRERIRFLEAIVNDVNKEKENLKAMIKQLTSSRVTFLQSTHGITVTLSSLFVQTVVDGTSSTAQSIVERASESPCWSRALFYLLLRPVPSTARSENPIRVLQTLLLKALTENERLKVWPPVVVRE